MTTNVLLLFEVDPLVTFALEELVTLFAVRTPKLWRKKSFLTLCRS